MAYAGIALRFFRKNLLLSAIMALQMSVTLILVNFLIGKYNVLADVLRISARFPGEDTYMYMPSPYFLGGEPQSDKLAAILDAHKGEIIFEQTSREILKTEQGEEYVGYALGGITSDLLDYPLIKGNWLEVASDGRIPCVSYPGRDVGDVIELYVDGSLRAFRVTGMLSRNANLPVFLASSNYPLLEHIFENEGRKSGLPMIIYNRKDIPRLPEISALSNAFVYMITDDGAARERIENEFRDIAWFVPIGTARENSADQLLIHIKTLAPMAASIFLVGIVSVICMSILGSMRNVREISIYYVCGMGRGAHLLLGAMTAACQTAAVCALVWLFWVFNETSNIVPADVMRLTGLNAAASGAILGTAMAASLISHTLAMRDGVLLPGGGGATGA